MTEEIINKIKETANADIVRVVSEYVSLKRSGKDMTGLCPFHNDTHSGNFMVSPAKRMWYCFVCGKGGDAVKFVQEYEHTDFIGAIKILAKILGIYVNDDAYDVSYKPSKRASTTPKEKPLQDIPTEIMRQYESTDSVLIDYLKSIIPVSDVEKVCQMYHIGATKEGWTVFNQIDASGRVRYMKKMEYLCNGHRNKDNKFGALGMHSEFKKSGLLAEDWDYTQCLFGEHLLTGNNKVVGLVESEKSAIICAMLCPELVWVATGGEQGLSQQRLSALKGRSVVVYADVDGKDNWQRIIDELRLNPAYCKFE